MKLIKYNTFIKNIFPQQQTTKYRLFNSTLWFVPKGALLNLLAAVVVLTVVMHKYLPAASTQYVYMGKEEFVKGTLKEVFVDDFGRLRLNLGYKKVLTSPAEMVWDMYLMDDKLVLGTGSSGEIFIYNTEELANETNEGMTPQSTIASEAAGIFSIAEGKDKTLYFGSATQGIVYMLPAGSNKLEVVAALGESYVWDVFYDEGNHRLLAAVGGNSGALYEIALNANGMAASAPKLMAAFPQFNALKIAMYLGEIYVSTSSRGKLYVLHSTEKMAEEESIAVDVKDIKEAEALPYTANVVYDAESKDISDYFFSGDFVTVATSGKDESDVERGDESLLGLGEKPAESIERASVKKNGKPIFTNKVVRIHLKTFAQQTLMEVAEKNILALANYPQQNSLLVALVENGEVLHMNLKTLLVQQLHYDKNISLSAMVTNGDNIYFSSAKNGEVYSLMVQLPAAGTFTSKVYPLKDVMAYGRIGIENYGYEQGIGVSIRSGRTETPDDSWSLWQDYSINDSEELYALTTLPPTEAFVQFRFTLTPQNTNVEKEGVALLTEEVAINSPIISDFLFFYSSRNKPPLLKNVSIRSNFQNKPNGVGKPATRGSFSAKLGIIEKLKSVSVPKGYELKWELENSDEDIIEYDVYYKKRGEEDWQLMMENHYDNLVSFDNGLFMDGVYRFKIVYNDYLSNGQKYGFEREALSPYHLVDNSPPVINVLQESATELLFEVKDVFSPVVSLYYSFDRKNYYQLLPEDGIFDNTTENFRLPFSKGLLTQVPGGFSGEGAAKNINIIVREISGNYLSTTLSLGANLNDNGANDR